MFLAQGVGTECFSSIAHPAPVGETYGEHCCSATSFGVAKLLDGAACLLHCVRPFVFTRTGSRIIARLHDRMVVSRMRPPQVAHGEGIRRS